MGKKNFFWIYTPLFLNSLNYRFPTVNQLVFAPVCTVAQVAFAAQCIYAGSRGFTFVVGPSFVPSLLGDPMFWMWHGCLFYYVIF